MRRYKGGGSSAPTETTVTQTDLPAYVEPYFKRLLQRGEAESIQGYDPYGGQRLSYFTPDELTSQAMTRGLAQSGTPQQFTDATNRYGMQGTIGSGYQANLADSGYSAGNLGQTYQAGSIAPQYQAGTATPAYTPINYEQNISRFMSPYQQNVIDIQKREATRASDIMGKGIEDQATAAGSLGGYREAILQAERQRNLGQQLGDIQATGSQAAFQSAQQQLAAERAAGLGASQLDLQRFQQQEAARQQQERLGQTGFQLGQQALQQQGAQQISAFQAGEQARQQAAKLGLSAAQQNEAARQAQEKFGQSAFDLSSRYNLQAAQGLQGIGQATQEDALGRISALQGIGSQQRALQQAGLDMGYQDFLRQQNYAMNQLGDFGSLLRGVPVRPEQTISTFQQQPGLFQTALGAGLTGLGLYRGYGGQR